MELGYGEVYNLGAFKDWAEGGGPVDKEPEMRTGPTQIARGPSFEWTGSLCSPQDSGAVR